MTIAQTTDRPLNWPVITFMVAIHFGALFALMPANFSWGAAGTAFLLYWITGCRSSADILRQKAMDATTTSERRSKVA